FQDENARLYNDLFNGYHREMSPFNGHGLVNDSYPLTPVTIALQYARLIRVLEPELQHQNLIGVLLDWQDPRLRWNPSEYGGIDHIYVNRFAIWMPDSQATIVSSEQSLTIRLNSSGFMSTFIIFSTYYSCEFDVYRFPFDEQKCYYCFIMFNYNPKSELRFHAKYSSRPYIYDTSEWALKLHDIVYQESVDEDFNMGLLFYNISFTRRPQFWVGLVITPTFLIGSLIIIGLFFGRGQDIINNAVGLGLTTMMSMMVIVGILADAFAKSQNIPILGWYLITEIIIIILAVLALMSSEMLCTFCSTVVTAACRESAIHIHPTKTGNFINSVKCFIREFLLERGKHSNVWLFSFFFLAHTINLIVLFSL
ncbi:hypothetical protein PMAYCL1PPCAC_07438, partial [Pristionchus mayeri]